MRRYTVPALAEELDSLLHARYPTILVEAEVGQVQRPASGHCYLQLRDKGGPRNLDCTLSAIVWRDDWNRLRYQPQVGERVLCRGRLAVFQPRGMVQLQVTEIAPVGLGDLAREIEARKARLMADGLLDPRRKRALPPCPRFVGVATSLTGAALQDFLKVSRHRYPAARILVAGCSVQGVETASSVIRALDLLAEDGRSEVVVVTRGGGSKEDLLPFHDEQLARYLAQYPVPLVSAVGHQIDTTIADLVADAVAPTPSAAAMLVLPDGPALAQRVDEAAGALEAAARRYLRRLTDRLAGCEARLRHPGDRLRDVRARLDVLRERLRATVDRRLRDDDRSLIRAEDRLLPAVQSLVERRRRRLEALEGRLRALSPLAVLDRGYAIATGPDGQVLTDPAQVGDGEALQVRVRGGTIAARVRKPVPDGVQLDLL